MPILLKVGDDISTDDIMPAGARVMPYWSNIPKTSEFTFELVDDTYAKRARQGGATRPGHAIVAGTNYGQGSSRENAALAPRYLGLEVVLAKSFARIHWQNLINFGVLPLTFSDPAIFDRLEIGDVVEIAGIEAGLSSGQTVTANINGKPLALRHACPHVKSICCCGAELSIGCVNGSVREPRIRPRRKWPEERMA